MLKNFLFLYFFCFALFFSCEKAAKTNDSIPKSPYLMVLGIAQDAGFPQAACKKDCCKAAWKNPELSAFTSCLSFVNPLNGRSWMFDATPDFKDQLYHLEENHQSQLNGIFLTHAHIGHYTGLIHLGREAIGAQKMPVYAMPKMREFLEQNGPWSQLVKLNNIALWTLTHNRPVQVDPMLKVTPLQVPHRDEYSETVGYSLEGPNKKALFIPDIDKWELWQYNIDSVIANHDLAFLDGSFFANGEIPGRDMSQIPHPFIEESLARFEKLEASDRAKIYFIHLNHTNPIIDPNSEATRKVEAAGMKVARDFDVFEM